MTEDNKRALLAEYNGRPHTESGISFRWGMERTLRELGYRFVYEDVKSLTSPATAIVEVGRV